MQEKSLKVSRCLLKMAKRSLKQAYLVCAILFFWNGTFLHTGIFPLIIIINNNGTINAPYLRFPFKNKIIAHTQLVSIKKYIFLLNGGFPL